MFFRAKQKAAQGLPRCVYFSVFALGCGSYVLVSPPVHALAQSGGFWLLGGLLALLGAAKYCPGKCPWYHFVLCLLVFSLGAGVNQLHLKQRIQRQLPGAYQGLPIVAEGEIIDLVRDNGQSWVFDVWLHNLRLAEGDKTLAGDGAATLAGFQGKVRLAWYKDQVAAGALQVGRKWQFHLRLRRPRGLVNPGVFDYHAWLLARSYVATGYVRSATAIPSGDSRVGRLIIPRLRQAIQQRLFAHAGAAQGEAGSESDAGRGARLTRVAVQQALLLGDKSGLSAEDWSLLQQTGTVHLMAISGLHVGLVAAMAFFAGQMLARLLPGSLGLLLVPASLSIAAASFYGAVAGFSIPTQRALVLVVMFNLAYCLGRRLSPFDVLAMAAALVVVLDPFAFLSPGFWLSFSAVWVLLFTFGLQRRPPSRWRVAIASQGAVLIGLLVPAAALGLPTSLTAPLANLLAIPVISLLVVPSLFFALAASWVSPGLAEGVLVLCDQLLNLLWYYFDFLLQLPLPLLWLAGGQPLALLALGGGLAAVLALAPRALGLRLLGLALLVLVLAPARQQGEGLSLTVLDVGQGLAVVLRHGPFTVVYDTGDQFSSSFDVGSRILAPFLRAQGVQAVNLLIVSHGDKDHAGGLRGLSQNFAIHQRVYGPDLKARARQDGGVPLCQAGMRWQFGQLSLRALHPDAEFLRSVADDNNLSCTILVEYQGFRALLPGDIEKAAEYYLLAAGDLLPVDVLLAPHHGSQTSSSVSLLANTQPKLAIFSTGFMNRYGHPSQKVLDRYQDLGVERLNTARQGAITVKVAPSGRWRVSRARAEQRRLWFDNP